MGSRFARTLSRRGRVKFSASAERASASLERLWLLPERVQGRRGPSPEPLEGVSRSAQTPLGIAGTSLRVPGNDPQRGGDKSRLAEN
jgi:hypothetical protein